MVVLSDGLSSSDHAALRARGLSVTVSTQGSLVVYQAQDYESQGIVTLAPHVVGYTFVTHPANGSVGLKYQFVCGPQNRDTVSAVTFHQDWRKVIWFTECAYEEYDCAAFVHTAVDRVPGLGVASLGPQHHPQVHGGRTFFTIFDVLTSRGTAGKAAPASRPKSGPSTRSTGLATGSGASSWQPTIPPPSASAGRPRVPMLPGIRTSATGPQVSAPQPLPKAPASFGPPPPPPPSPPSTAVRGPDGADRRVWEDTTSEGPGIPPRRYWSRTGHHEPTLNGAAFGRLMPAAGVRVVPTLRVIDGAVVTVTPLLAAAHAAAPQARAAGSATEQARAATAQADRALATLDAAMSEGRRTDGPPRQPPNPQEERPQHAAFVAQVELDSVEVDLDRIPRPRDFANLAVPLRPGEIVYDPGATAEMGSLAAWEQLDSAMQERYGAEYGFTTRPTTTTFRVADGNSTTPKGATAFQAVFDIPRVGCFTLAGVGIPCSKEDAAAQTPVLFGCAICEELRMVMDHELQQLHSKALGVTAQCRRAPTRHLLLPIFDFLDSAGAHPLPKSFVASAWTAIPSTLEPYPETEISKND